MKRFLAPAPIVGIVGLVVAICSPASASNPTPGGAVALGVPAQSAPLAPSPVTLVDVGTYRERVATGTFEASGLLCPSGTFTESGAELGQIRAIHSCRDGTGTFTLTENTALKVWELDGTGRYASLRGRLTCKGVSTEPPSFGRGCEGIADLDDVAPSARIAPFTIRRSGKAYVVKVGFSARDNVEGNTVSFKLALVAGRRLAAKAGETDGGTTLYVFKLRPPKSARTLTVVLELTDPVGNTAKVRRSKKLR